MNWEGYKMEMLEWPGNILNREQKEQVARKVVEKVEEGQVIGIGSGSTVYLAVLALAEKIRQENLHIKVIPASLESSMICMQLGIPQTTLWKERPDWTMDGADEVDPAYNLIKGRGGAMFKEKLLIRSSVKTYIMVDKTKRVDRLGARFPIPIEVFPAALVYVQEQMKRLGANRLILRLAKGKDGPVITENGNLILDVWFDSISLSLEKEIKYITGVIESGLFIGYPVQIVSFSDWS